VATSATWSCSIRRPGVEPWARDPNLNVDIGFGWWDEDEEDGDDTITIREAELPPPAEATGPVEAAQAAEAANDEFDWWEPAAEPTRDPDPRLVTLRFLPDSVAVHYIAGLDYTPAERNVHVVRLPYIPEDQMPF
jgi:hypothetical protein